MTPDFVFIGPSKSGSSWIFELLRSHPDIYVPIAKDIYFFDEYYKKGIKWYEKYFQEAKSGQVKGELSHDYLSSNVAIQRIKECYPTVKLICCLRNPYERAVSSYNFIKRNGLVSCSLSDAIDDYPEIHYEGLYYSHLQNVLRYFAKEQLLVLYFEELRENPKEFAKKLFKFLGVDENYESEFIGKIVNKASEPRSVLMAKTLKMCALVMRKMGFISLLGSIKRNVIVKRLLYKEVQSVYVKSDDVVLPENISKEYNKEIDSLMELMKVDLSSWKRILN